MQNLDGKTAFVTGAASGIGLAITKALTARGCHVMMADIDMANLEAAQASLPSAAGRTAIFQCDVTKADNVRAGADKTLSEFGKVHMVFNNAGVAIGGQPGRIALKDWQWIIDINLMGVCAVDRETW